jgi:DNA end-binding protein Ku
MRAIWTGSIGFGLVNIPVKLYSASESSSLDLRMLNKRDLSPIKYKRIDEETGNEVKWEDIVKGYDVGGEYVVLEDDDFEKASLKKSRVIEIDNFVPESAIPTTFYEKPYYLEPGKDAAHAYSLLLDALQQSKKVGIASFVLRNREALAVLKPGDNVIVLNQIRFPEEIRSTRGLNLPEKKTFSKKELDLALSLINQFSSKLDLKDYKDTYTDELMKLIRQKAQGKIPATPKLKVVPTKTTDLMKQLKASLEKKKKAA